MTSFFGAKSLRRDFIFICVMGLSAAILAAVLLTNRHSGHQVVVLVNGREQVSLSLEENQSYTIDDGYGGENHLVIQDGIACIDEANCPDRICVLQGAISQTGDCLICLPHGVVVEIRE